MAFVALEEEVMVVRVRSPEVEVISIFTESKLVPSRSIDSSFSNPSVGSKARSLHSSGAC